MNLRIIAMGKDFKESNRVSMLCQQVSIDDFGCQTLGSQFHWEIMKDTLTPEITGKIQEVVDSKAVIERPWKLQEVTRTNPTTGEVITKLIAS